MYVIFGASGNTGGEVARNLIELGEPVRVAVRGEEKAKVWREKGAQAAIVGDIADEAGVAAALDGASAAYVLNPPRMVADPLANAAAVGAALRAAVKRAQLPRLVVLSSVGAGRADGTGIIETLHVIEEALAGAAPSVAFLRPGHFVETWGESLHPVTSEGVLPSFLDPSLKFPMVSVADIGRLAADLMRDTWSGDRVVELGGPVDYSLADVSDAFAGALKRPVTPVPVPPADQAAILVGAGMTPGIARGLTEMYAGIAAGRVAFDPARELRRGTTALPEAVARMVAAAA